jgi:type I restriction enzyme S subunit
MREGWDEEKLGEVCNMIKRGIAPKYTDEIALPVINQKCIRNHEIDLSLVRYHDQSKKNVPSERIVRLGDVLINSTGTGTLGRVAQVRKKFDRDYTVDTHVTIVRPIQELFYYDFFGYALIHIEEEITKSGKGTSGQTELSRQKLEGDFKIKYPLAIHEQKRIVAILDEAFEAIDLAKANIEQNIQNAEELFQSKLNEIFFQRGEGWEEKKLKDITTKIGSGATPRGGKKNYKKSGISLIRSLNVYDEGFQEDKLAFIDNEQAEKLSNVEIQKGDVLLNITGASVARCCVVPVEYLPARVNQHVSIIRLKESTMHESFLHYLLLSKPYKSKLLGIGEQGATRQAITKSQIQDFTVRYPSDFEEQDKIIQSLNRNKELTNELISKYEHGLRALEELKKSILQKAFSGELTSTEDVEQISRAAEAEEPYVTK